MADVKLEQDARVPQGQQWLYRGELLLAQLQLGEAISLPLADRVLVHPKTYEMLMQLRARRNR